MIRGRSFERRRSRRVTDTTVAVILLSVIPRNNPINAYTMGIIIQDAGLTVEEFKKVL